VSNDHNPGTQAHSNGETPGTRPASGGPEWTRRNFLYGSAAAAAAGAFMGRPSPAGRQHPATRRASLARVTGLAPLTWQQSGPQANGTTSVTVTLSSPPKPNSLLVATLISNASGVQFTPPGSPSPWRLAKAVTFAKGQAEIWYYPGTPPSPGNPGGTGNQSFTFTNNSANNCRGAVAEFDPGDGVPSTAIAVLDAVGEQSGTVTDGTFSLTAASGNVAGALGIALAADFFSTNTTGTFTGPSGYTQIAHAADNILHCWSSWYDQDLGSGAQSLSATFNVTANETSQAFAFAAFRAVYFQGLHVDGAEMTNIVALDPTNQELILGGDVEGAWRSADFGDHWQISQDGIYGSAWRYNAAVAWSQPGGGQPAMEPGAVYACAGKHANANPPDGGFMASTDGGVTWQMRAPGTEYSFLVFQANSTDPALLSSDGVNDAAERTAGNLIAQDPVNGYMYVATYNQGIARSSKSTPPIGTKWVQIGLTSGNNNYYARALAINPGNYTELWAGFWDSDGTGQYGGVWYCADAPNAANTNWQNYWTQLPNPNGPETGGNWSNSNTVADLKLIGGYLYAACPTKGIFRYDISKGTTGTWQSLNGGATGKSGWFLVSSAQGQLWTGLDGYVDSAGNHQIFAACANGVQETPVGSPTPNPNVTNLVQITITSSGTISYADLTGPSNINLNTVPPDNQPWWHYVDGFNASYQNYLGGSIFGNAHVLVNPATIDTGDLQIFVTGSGGFFRTKDSGQNWEVAVNGAPACGIKHIANDPTPGNSNHIILCGTDYPQIDLTDPTGWNSGSGDGVQVFRMPDSTVPNTGTESNATAMYYSGTATTVYTGVNVKYAQNYGGMIYSRPSPTTNTAKTVWADTGYGAAVPPVVPPTVGTGAPAPVGIYAGLDGTTPYLLAATVGGGMWRATFTSGSWNWGTGPVTTTPLSGSPDLCLSPNAPVEHCPIVTQSIAGGFYLFCFDRASGIWRSSNNGKSWTQIWAITSNDNRSGWIALNPAASSGELWVSAYGGTNAGLWKLASPTTGKVGGTISATPMGGTFFPNGSGGIAFTSAGTIYAVSLDGQFSNGSPQPTSAQLLSLTNGGPASGWADADTDSTFTNAFTAVGSYISWPGQVAMATATINGTAQDIVIATSFPNMGIYGVTTA
jgi:hypothetical protein